MYNSLKGGGVHKTLFLPGSKSSFYPDTLPSVQFTKTVFILQRKP